MLIRIAIARQVSKLDDMPENGSGLVLICAGGVVGRNGEVSLRTVPFSRSVFKKIKAAFQLSGMRTSAPRNKWHRYPEQGANGILAKHTAPW